MKKVFAALAALACAAAVAAQTPPSPHAQDPQAPPGAPQLELGPEQLLQRGLDRLSGYLRGADNPEPRQIRAFLDQEIAPYFDFRLMARWSAGRLYYRLTGEQQAQLTARLQELFLSALARNLGAYAQPLPRIEIYPSRTPPWM